MIRPSQDSRRSLCQNNAQSRPTSPPPKQTKKRKPGPAESESESEEESEDKLADTDDSEPVVVSKANKKIRGSQSKSTTSKRTRGSKSQSQSTVANSQNASGTVNLTQDSDAENSKVRKKRQRKNPEFDAIKAYFSEAFHRDGDVSQLII
jgi:D-alanyl-D-alanine carboxypeptidase